MTTSLPPDSKHTNVILRDPRLPKLELSVYTPAKLDEAASKVANAITAALSKEVFGKAPPHADKRIVVDLTENAVKGEDNNSLDWVAKASHSLATQILDMLKGAPAPTSHPAKPPQKPTGSVGSGGAMSAATSGMATANVARECMSQAMKCLSNEETPEARIKFLKNLVGHVIGDPFLSSTGLEGAMQTPLMIYLKAFLERKLKTMPDKIQAEASQDIIAKLNRGIELKLDTYSNPSKKEIDSIVSQIQKQLKSLKPGEGTIISGGWTSRPAGHALYYEIVKEQGDTYSLRVYNSGLGIELHPGMNVYDGDTPERKPQAVNMHLPYFQLEGIAPEQMLNPYFWQAAVEIKTCTEWESPAEKKFKKPTRYDLYDIYHTLLSLLHVRPSTSSTLDLTACSEQQRSGTCAWMGLQAILGTKFPSETSQSFLHELQVDSLQALFVEMDSNTLAGDEQARTLLAKSAAQFVLNATERYATKSITIEELEQATALASKIRHAVELAEKMAQKALGESAPIVSFPQAKTLAFYAETPSSHYANYTKRDDRYSQLGMEWNSKWEPKSETISLDLETFCKNCAQAMPRNPMRTLMCIKEYLLKLPVPKKGDEDAFWNSVAADKREACMGALVQLCELVSKACAKSRTINSIEKNEYSLLLEKANYIVHKLVVVGGGEPSGMLDINQHSFVNPSLFFDHQILQQLKAINEYVSHYLNEGPVHFFQNRDNDYFADSYSLHDDELTYACKYTSEHTKEFDAIFGAKFLQFLESKCEEQREIDRLRQDKRARATFAFVTDNGGEFFPKNFSHLRNISHIAKAFPYHKVETTLRILYSLDARDKWEGEGWKTITDFAGDYSRQNSAAHTSSGNDLLGYMDGKYTDKEFAEFSSILEIPTKEGSKIPQEMQVIKALHYFSVNLHKLKDHNILCFFRQVVFTEDHLETALQQNPGLARQFVQFLQKGYMFFAELNDPSSQTHMVYLAILLKHRLSLIAKSHQDIEMALHMLQKEGLDQMHRSPLECLGHMLKGPPTLEVQSQIHSMILFHHAKEFPGLKEHEIHAILAGCVSSSAFLNLQRPPIKLQHVENDIAKLMFLLIPYLKAASQDNKLMSAIAQNNAKILGLSAADAKVDWSKVTWHAKDFPMCEGSLDGKLFCILNLLDNSFSRVVNVTEKRTEFQRASLFPADISNHPDFRRNFAAAPSGMVAVFSSETASHSWNFYNFCPDDKGLRVNAGLAGDAIILYRQFERNGNWYEYQPPKKMEAVIDNKILLEQYTHWQRRNEFGQGENEILFCKAGTSEVVYKTVSAGPGKIIIEQKNKPLRLLPSSEENCPQPYETLTRFELREYMLVWCGIADNAPQSIEMPRLSLSFQVGPCQVKGEKIAKNRAKCREIPGYWIADYQHVPALGSFENYLVLQNAEGMIKVVIPRKPINALSRGGLTSNICLQRDFPDNPDAIHPPYFEYTVNGKGELEAEHEAGDLFHAYLLQGQARYAEAQAHFRVKARKLGEITPRELNNFLWITQLYELQEDNDPKACAVYLTALAILLKNVNIHGIWHKDVSRELDPLKKTLRRTYENYLSRRHQMGSLWLLPEEELSITRYLATDVDLDTMHKEMFNDRISTLTGLAKDRTAYIRIIPQSRSLAHDFTFLLSFLHFIREYTGRRKKEKARLNQGDLLTQTDGKILLDAKALYVKAKSAKGADCFEMARKFEAQAAFASIVSDSERFYYFLTAVAWNPKDFPEWEGVVKASENWHRDTEPEIKRINDAFWKNYRAYLNHPEASHAPSKPAEPSAPGGDAAATVLVGSAAPALFSNKIDVKLAFGIQDKAGALPAAANGAIAPAASATPAEIVKERESEPAYAAPKQSMMKMGALPAAGSKGATPAAIAALAQLSNELDIKQAVAAPPLTERHGVFFPAAPSSIKLAKPAPQQTPVIILKEMFTKAQEGHYSVSAPDIKTLKSQLAVAISADDGLPFQLHESKRISNKLRVQILELANKGLPAGAQAEHKEKQALLKANIQAGNIPPFTIGTVIQDLSYGFLRNNSAELQKRNSHLTKGDIDQLYYLLVSYLEHSTAEQTTLRQEAALKDIAQHIAELPDNHHIKADLILEELAEKAAKELATVPAHSAKENPREHLPFLIFEAATGFSLRKDQVDSLSSLIRSDFEVRQLIMGAGKSKLLLPILALLKADGDALPVIIIPAPLFDTTAKDMRKNVGEAFNRNVHTLSFERNAEFSKESLELKYRYLEEIRANKECLMMTSKSLQCLSLKFREALLEFAKKPEDADLQAKVQMLQKILRLIKTKGKAIIDEADWILDSRVEVNFTYGKGSKLNENRCGIVALLYEQLQSPDIQKTFNGDPLDGFTMSLEAYRKGVLPVLADKMMTLPPFNTLPKPELVKKYLCGIRDEEAEKYVKASPEADALALLKEELNSMLPLSLSKRFCVDYGPSQKTLNGEKAPRMLAIPYNGNNTSVESAEFRSPDMIMNYTLQTWWKKGIPASEIERCITLLQTESRNEMLPFDQTAAFKQFKDLCGDLQGITFYGCTQADFVNIANRINNARNSTDPHKPPNPHLFFDYMAKYVLPQIIVYEEQLTSNAIDLVDMFHSAVGFTGTPWNYDTFPEPLRKNIKKAPEVEKDIAELLIKKTQAADGIRLLKSTELTKMIAEIVRPADDALIDAGAAFNGQPNDAVAAGILDRLQSIGSKRTGVVFFKDNQLVVLEATTAGRQTVPFHTCRLKPHERFTYYDHPHSIGTDIAQHPLAQATQTIGKDTTFRDTGQGAYRMRGLPKKQSISLIVTPEADTRLREQRHALAPNFTCQEILSFNQKNENEQKLALLQISIKQKIDHAVNRAVDDLLLSIEITPSTCAAAKTLIDEVRHILVSKQSVRPIDCYETTERMTPKEAVVQQIILNAIKKLKAISEASSLFKGRKDAFIGSVEQKIAADLGDAVGLLPKDISSHLASTKNSDGQAEREQENETSRQSMQHAHKASLNENRIRYDRKIWWKNWYPPKLLSAETYSPLNRDMPVEGLDAMYDTVQNMKQFSPIFGKDLLACPNRIPDKQNGLQSSLQLASQYVLYIRNIKDKTLKMLFLDAKSDMTFFWHALSQERKKNYYLGGPQEVELCMCSLNGDVVQHDSSINMNDSEHLFVKAMKEKGPELRARAKLALGHLSFAQDEIRHVQGVMKETGAKLIAEYYRQHILVHDAEKQSLYPESPICRLLGDHGV